MPIRCSRGEGQQAVGSLHLGFRRKVRAANGNLDVISREMVFTAPGLDKTIPGGSVTISFTWREGQKLLHGKDFCKL